MGMRHAPAAVASVACARLLPWLMLLTAAPAFAQATTVADEDARTTYADAATIRKQDQLATMSVLIDFRNAQRAPYGPQYLSQQLEQQFDCPARRARVLEASAYAGQMATEDVVAVQDAPEEWKSVAGQPAEALWKLACARAD